MGQRVITKNTLFYGDNLDIMRQYMADETIDLIYLDPPFNSSRNYNVLYKDESGAEAESQIVAFEDTWTRFVGVARQFTPPKNWGASGLALILHSSKAVCMTHLTWRLKRQRGLKTIGLHPSREE